jgi:hypothetical protein
MKKNKKFNFHYLIFKLAQIHIDGNVIHLYPAKLESKKENKRSNVHLFQIRKRESADEAVKSIMSEEGASFIKRNSAGYNTQTSVYNKKIH